MEKNLATDVDSGGKKATGVCTPKEDHILQRMSVPPKRVIPIVFLPGIMGSNLRVSPERQAELRKSNNIAWRPDKAAFILDMVTALPAQRQAQLDHLETEVDTYDPMQNHTGDSKETSESRHNLGLVHVNLNLQVDSPFLVDDPPAMKGAKTKEQKAKERGWGEVYFDSYKLVLERCEQYLNTPFKKRGDLQPFWKKIVGVDPKNWQANANPTLEPITKDELTAALKGAWFPVHAMGYNWLGSNRRSAKIIAARIKALISSYRARAFRCEKVIVVTHSMGGLVGRALVHPRIGGMADSVLGIVHGVMPATGAAAAYKRMRCGFEGGAAKVLGDTGEKVTAVLANAPGGLELLPCKGYGNGWLEIRKMNKVIASLPANGDPYEEIYKVTDKWYGLLRPDWINPAGQNHSTVERTRKYLEEARQFHEDISDTYHKLSFAHYGADKGRPSWECVTWNIAETYNGGRWADLLITNDDLHGNLTVVDQLGKEQSPISNHAITLGDPVGPGDETVPLRSAEQQLQSGKFSGIFRQTGYEHQGSYSNEAALNSTIYSLVRIIQTMTWSEG